MATCETVKIEHPDGFAVINKSEFDPATHKEFDENKSNRNSNSRSGKDGGK